MIAPGSTIVFPGWKERGPNVVEAHSYEDQRAISVEFYDMKWWNLENCRLLFVREK